MHMHDATSLLNLKGIPAPDHACVCLLNTRLCSCGHTGEICNLDHRRHAAGHVVNHKEEQVGRLQDTMGIKQWVIIGTQRLMATARTPCCGRDAMNVMIGVTVQQ